MSLTPAPLRQCKVHIAPPARGNGGVTTHIRHEAGKGTGLHCTTRQGRVQGCVVTPRTPHLLISAPNLRRCHTIMSNVSKTDSAWTSWFLLPHAKMHPPTRRFWYAWTVLASATFACVMCDKQVALHVGYTRQHCTAPAGLCQLNLDDEHSSRTHARRIPCDRMDTA